MNGIFYGLKKEFLIIAVFGRPLEIVYHILSGGDSGRRRLAKSVYVHIREIVGHF